MSLNAYKLPSLANKIEAKAKEAEKAPTVELKPKVEEKSKKLKK